MSRKLIATAETLVFYPDHEEPLTITVNAAYLGTLPDGRHLYDCDHNAVLPADAELLGDGQLDARFPTAYRHSQIWRGDDLRSRAAAHIGRPLPPKQAWDKIPLNAQQRVQLATWLQAERAEGRADQQRRFPHEVTDDDIVATDGHLPHRWSGEQ